MTRNQHPDHFDPAIQDLIRRKARQLTGRAGFRAHDREDLEQELCLLLLKRLPAFDGKRGKLERFVAMALARYGVNLLRRQRAGKRDHRRTRQLRDPDRVPWQGADARYLRGRSPEELVDLAMDVASVLDQLPLAMRELAERLMKASPAQVARDLGMARTTLYTRIRNLRQRFEHAGLSEFLVK